MYEYYKKKFHVYYFWELKGEIKERFSRLIWLLIYLLIYLFICLFIKLYCGRGESLFNSNLAFF